MNHVDLIKHFHGTSDEELLNCCGSGYLTEVAQSIADAELSSRGLNLNSLVTTPDESTPYAGGFETVAQFFNPTDAYVVTACLEAAGVPAFVADANLVQANSLLSIAIGGVRIQVPTARAAEAINVIEAFNRGDFALSDDDDSYREHGNHSTSLRKNAT